MTVHKFAFPTTIHFGPGARMLVASHLKEAGRRRPLIVTDTGIAALPVLAEFLEILRELEAHVYSGVHGNPVASQVHAGAEAYRARGASSRRSARARSTGTAATASARVFPGPASGARGWA